ncbi:MAG: hypothetical protein AAF242_13060, partial [Bacteroidota bacterium]
KIQEKEDSFDYDLKIDYEAQTTLNQQRKDEEKADRKAYLLSVLVLVVLYFILYWLFTYIKSLQ